MKQLISGICLMFITLPLFAQQQQAGNAASTDTQGTFQALIDACDDVDALVLRARIRLQLPRTTDEAAVKAQSLLEKGFATCGGGDLETAKSQLSEALAIAEAGVSETFAADESTKQSALVKDSEQDDIATETLKDSSQEKTAWWKFW